MGKSMQLDKDDIDAILVDVGFRQDMFRVWTNGRTRVHVTNHCVWVIAGFESLFMSMWPVDSGEFMEALARAELKG